MIVFFSFIVFIFVELEKSEVNLQKAEGCSHLQQEIFFLNLLLAIFINVFSIIMKIEICSSTDETICHCVGNFNITIKSYITHCIYKSLLYCHFMEYNWSFKNEVNIRQRYWPVFRIIAWYKFSIFNQQRFMLCWMRVKVNELCCIDLKQATDN